MVNCIRLILLCGIIVLASTATAQNEWEGFEHLFTTPKTYVACKTTTGISIDGQANENDWDKAEWTDLFEDIEGGLKPKPLHDTRIKMLWDNNNLYVFAKLEEPHIWAYYKKNDMIVYHENDFEVFIDPNRDTHNYYEFEVNAQNTLFDLFMNKPYRNGGSANIPWNAEGFESAVHINGTLNNPNDKDENWTIEMKIPFSALSTDGNFVEPVDGDVWKINFSRVQWQTKVVDGKYVKKINPETDKHYPEYNWVWSPQGVINMHYPERWSMVQFSGKAVGSTRVKFKLPVEEEFAKHLWLIYYKQRKFAGKNRGYATSLAKLNIEEKGKQNGTNYQLELKAEKRNYTATLKTDKGLTLTINQEGLVEVLKK